MAFWNRRNGRVCVYEWRDGKQKAVPRKEVAHLDGQPDEVVNRYVDSLGAPPPGPRLMTRRLEELAQDFAAAERERGLDPATVSLKLNALLFHAVPYFLSLEPPREDPAYWAPFCPHILPALRSKGLAPRTILRTNEAVRHFWRWLQDQGLADVNTALRLRNPRAPEEPTPLQFALKPDEVLAWAAAQPGTLLGREMALLGLCGYFCSLRTQEVLALTAADFKAGPLAAAEECCLVFARAGLYNKLAVHITKQARKAKGGGNKALKTKRSKGWVACFDERAARAIVGLVKELAKQGELGARLVRFGVDYNLKRWREHGIPGITLKDLRRASILYLGHYHTQLGLIGLRSHARHSQSSTTELYLRRPDSVVQDVLMLDLDA